MRIVSRSEWGARHDRGAGPAPLPAKYLHVHHAVTKAINGPGIIRQIEQTGEDRFGRGISYTFAITPDGTVYEGHGIDREGTHTRGRNKTGRAIVFVGQFHPAEKAIPATWPTPEALEACAQLVAHGYREVWWPDQITSGHRDAPGASTACPGDWLNAEIPAINRRVRELLDRTPTPEPGDTMTPEQEAKLDRVLAILDRLDGDYLTRGKGVRQVIATIDKRTEDLVTGKRPAKP